VAAYGRGSRSRKETITDQTEWSQGNDIVDPGRHGQQARYVPKWIKLGKHNGCFGGGYFPGG